VVLQQLRRVRWAVRATLILGVAASVVANVLHALDNPISQAIAAWPPLALLLTVELISRVPVHRRWLAAARLLATATIAGIAAWVSYWHMVGVAARYGETGASPYLLPLSVDGLIVVASICLVELGGRITTLERPQPTAHPARAAAEKEPSPAAAQPSFASAQPSFASAQPSFAAAQPSFASAQPSFAAAQPSFAAATPSFPAAPQSVGATQQSPGAAQPSLDPRQPSLQPAHASLRSAQPAFEFAEPSLDRPQADPATTPIPGLISAPAATAGIANGNTSLRRSTAAALAEVAAALPRANSAAAADARGGFAPALTTRQTGQPRPASARPATRSTNAVPAERSNAVPAERGNAVPAQRGNVVPAQRGKAATGTRTVPAQQSKSTRTTSTVPAQPGKSAPAVRGRASAESSALTERKRRTPAETLALADLLKAERPALTDNEIAAELGITTSRLRTVRREAGAQTIAA
jgi:hypothetical protein